MPPTQTQISAQFARLHISQHDFEEAEEYLDELARQASAVARRALLTAAVIAYARPFTQNESSSGGKATPQVPGRMLRDFTTSERKLHSRLLDLRSKAVAHSTYASRPIKKVTVMQSGFSVEGSYFDLLSEGLDRTLFQAMSRKLRIACRVEKLELSRKLPLGEGAA
jgi:hypothetical protein